MPIGPSKLASPTGCRSMSGFRGLSYTGRAGRNARRTCNQTKAHFCWLMRITAPPAGVFAERSHSPPEKPYGMYYRIPMVLSNIEAAMTSPTHREFACALIIDTVGRFLLQQRDDIPGIIQAGKIGMFGGHREASEFFLECVAREIREEISYAVPEHRFEYLTSYNDADIDAAASERYAESVLSSVTFRSKSWLSPRGRFAS